MFRTDGYRHLRFLHDLYWECPNDTKDFWFAIAENLYHYGWDPQHGVPAEWGFKDSILHTDENYTDDSSLDYEISQLIEQHRVTYDDLVKFGWVTFRYWHLMALTGEPE